MIQANPGEGDIVKLLRGAGYQVVNGAAAVRRTIAINGHNSGWKPASPTPVVPPHGFKGTQADWQSLTPGMRREITRAAAKRNPEIVMTAAEISLMRKISHLANQPRTLANARELKKTEERWHKLIGKKNPGGPSLAAAKRLYKKFIGKAASKLTRKTTAHPAAKSAKGGKLPVAKLATLSYLKIKNSALKDGMIRFRGAARPKLLSHPSGRQYYFHGGGQNLDGIPAAAAYPKCNPPAYARAGIGTAALRKMLNLGQVTEIGYFERKAVEDFRPVEYYHALGEENGKRPVLVYDPEHKQMHLVGGDYRTLWSGINN